MKRFLPPVTDLGFLLDLAGCRRRFIFRPPDQLCLIDVLMHSSDCAALAPSLRLSNWRVHTDCLADAIVSDRHAGGHHQHRAQQVRILSGLARDVLSHFVLTGCLKRSVLDI